MTSERQSQIGTIIAGAAVSMQAIGVICVGLWFVFGSRTTADQSTLDLRAFRTEVAAQFADVKTQIASLPDQRAAATQVERRITESVDRNSKQDDRIAKQEQDIYQLKADVSTLLRASGLPVAIPALRR